MNETFIKLMAALAYCDTDTPGLDTHARWTALLQAMYRLRDVQAHEFLTRINNGASPNEAPAELLLRSHQMAKALLPELLREYREARATEKAETNHNKFLRQQAESDPFLEDANLTRDAYSGRGDPEVDFVPLLDAWGNVRQ